LDFQIGAKFKNKNEFKTLRASNGSRLRKVKESSRLYGIWGTFQHLG
jgi:hypothetical protein